MSILQSTYRSAQTVLFSPNQFDTSVAGRYRETCSLGYSQHSRSCRSQSWSTASSHANLRPPPTARLNPSGPAEATANLPEFCCGTRVIHHHNGIRPISVATRLYPCNRLQQRQTNQQKNVTIPLQIARPTHHHQNKHKNTKRILQRFL